jgi:AraC-like DNA-binding protein
VIVSFIGFSTALSFLFSISEFFTKNRSSKNIYLGCIFICVSFFLGQSYFWSSGLILQYPHFLHVHILFTVLLGPLLERYLILVWENKVEEIRKFYLKCLLCLSSSTIAIPIYIQSYEFKLDFIKKSLSGQIPPYSRIIVLVTVLVLSYFFIRLLIRFFNLFRSSTLKNSITLQLILVILLLGLVCVSLGALFIFQDSLDGLKMNGVFIGGFLVFLFLLKQRNPEILQEVRRIVEEEKKYKISQLKKLNLDNLEKKLIQLMEEKKIYLEDKFTLNDLALELEITSHQLSEYLNQERKTSFAQLLNKYRISEAKKLLIENKEDTILSIAYQVGYQNKSTFNDIFKKETGLTPSEFRKKKSKNL